MLHRQRLCRVLLVLCCLLVGTPLRGTAQNASKIVAGPEKPVPASLFNLVIVRWRNGASWPTVNFFGRREWAAWDRLEPVKGQWNFDFTDSVVAAGQAKGVETDLVLCCTPTWASARPTEAGSGWPNTAGNRAESKDPSDWRRYASTVAARYKGRVQTYELWNEPDGTFSGSFTALSKLSCDAYAAIKQVDPTAVVVSPTVSSAASLGSSYFKNMLTNGIFGCADVIGFHSYVYQTGGGTPGQPEDAFPHYLELHRLLKNHGIDKPIWNTEIGWNISNSDGQGKAEKVFGAPLPPEVAAAVVARTFIISWAAGIDRVYWFAWSHPHMGLTESDLKTPKPAATAFSTIQRWLIGSRMSSLSISPDGVWVAALSTPRKAWIVWHPKGKYNFVLPPDWKAKRIRSLDGSSSDLMRKAVVTVDDSPVMFE